MIAIAGTIGTGLFLGTGRSLAQGGPASMLICYAVVGFIVYITLLLLGEMATQYPVAGVYSLRERRPCRHGNIDFEQARSMRTQRASSLRLMALLCHGTTGSTMQSLSHLT